MPKALPWFDNSVDSTLPTTIKPELYAYDQYQIYDFGVFEFVWLKFVADYGNTTLTNLTLLESQGRVKPLSFYADTGLPSAYKVLLPESFNSASLYSHEEVEHLGLLQDSGNFVDLGQCLIQRFSPEDYPWADQYILKMYESMQDIYWYLVLLPLSSQSTNTYYLIRNVILPSLIVDDFINSGIMFSSSNFLILPRQPNLGRIIISYLYYDPGSENKNIASKGFKVIHYDDKQTVYPFPILNCIPASMVISIYPNDSDLLAIVKNQIINFELSIESRILTYAITDENRIIAPYYALYENFDLYVLLVKQSVIAYLNETEKVVFVRVDETLEDRYHIYFANNDYWKNGSIPSTDINPDILPVLRNRLGLDKSIDELDLNYYRLSNQFGYVGEDMPDSVRVVEIHSALKKIQDALDSDKFSIDQDGNKRVANLGYLIERIARVLGISVNPNGSIRSIRQKAIAKRGETIPAGWYFGQFGVNEGGSREGQQGGSLVYEQRSNRVTKDKFSGEAKELVAGDYTLCENLPQYLDEMLDDLDKALGWQELGAWSIPNADGSSKVATYEGLHSLLSEVAYMSSAISKSASQTHVSSLLTQAVCYEILKAFGVPLTPKTFPLHVGGREPANVAYPGLAEDAPSQYQQFSILLQNLSVLVGSQVRVNDDSLNGSESK
jgi:hypothetical protein